MASLIQVFLAGVLLVGFVAAAPVADEEYHTSFGFKSEEPGHGEQAPEKPASEFDEVFYHDQPAHDDPAPEEPTREEPIHDFVPVFHHDDTAYETSAGEHSFSFSDDQGHSSTFDGTEHAIPHHELAAAHETPLFAHEDAVTENHEEYERSFGADDSQHEDTVTETPSHSFLPSFPQNPFNHDTTHEEEEEDHGSFSRH
ncbi:uncharacterized protein LOC123502155 isoform X3 [Portunus trituberculatus]|uniref:uncharacterized protein LOC123502155 isoform X3 n=1 Tax=Portunus trituberculatus TaxID=210409 RepID=UPI001E1CEB63|nr:uncharacterized protein LOC123502155 isoform X3 [Portunus trituberculatus]